MQTDPHDGDTFKLCNVIRETSFAIQSYLRNGHREIFTRLPRQIDYGSSALRLNNNRQSRFSMKTELSLER